MSTSFRKINRLLAAVLVPAMLSACKSSGGVASDEPAPPAPGISISANPAVVDPDGMSTVTWNATDVQSCVASGAWTGNRPTSGNEDVGPLAANAEFTLQCTGSGGSTTQSITVTVNSGGGPAPTLTFGSPTSTVPFGTAATLTWDTNNVDSCEASGDWSGSRQPSGSESTGELIADETYTLTCSGPGGNVSDTLTLKVSESGSSGILGSVDSSLIDRRGQNRVYLYSGSVTPDDYDGDAGDPMMSGVVRQDSGTCTFSYDLGALSAGDYTLAFTNEAAADNPLSSDSIAFSGVQTVSVGANKEFADFLAANIIRVGPGRAYQTVSAVADVAQDGDVVEIDAGEYVADVAAWYQNNLTLRGVGGYAHLRAAGTNSQGKAIWVIGGTNTVVENIEFSEITVPDQNGAGIRADGRDLVVCNGYFHDSEEGILGGAGDVLVEYSEFDNNGYGDGQSHNMYILEADSFTLRHSYSHHARIGHNVKTRAAENYILYNRIMDESTGNSSYAIDIPNGGLSFVIGNLLQQGPNTDNSSIANYGTEGLVGGRTHHLYMINNTLVDDYGGNFVQAAGGTSLVRLVNNLFVGTGSILTGASGSMTSNLQTTAPGLASIDAFDYRLTAGSPARDAGTTPGPGDGVDLIPTWHYLHERNREQRPVVGTIDVGAYEFSQ